MAKEKANTEKTSFNLDTSILKRIKLIALLDDKTQTEVIETALSEYADKWEKKHGQIPKKT